MENKRSLALVGAGRWGKNLARNFDAIGALHTICDSNQSLFDQYRSQYPEVAIADSYDSVLANPAIKAIAIAAPAALHYTLAEQALIAGKHVYVEKPLCLNASEGKKLIALAEKRGLILMVGHLLQYHPCVLKLQQMIAGGELGKLQYITSNRLNLGSIRTEENALWSFAPHDISVILSLCGNAMPLELRCSGGAYLSKGIADTTLTTLAFENDVKAHIYVSWLHPYKEQKLVVIGSEGMAVFDDTKPWGEKLMLFRDHITWDKGSVPQAKKNDGHAVSVEEKEPLKEECLHFIACCETGEKPRTDGAEGLRVLKVLQAAQQSLNSGGDACYPDEEEACNIFAHPSAIVDDGATIGEGTKIWHFSHIMGGAIIGKRCNIGQNVLISSDASIGDGVKVQNNVSIYGGITCEDEVFLGPSMVFTNIKNPRSAVCRKGEYLKTTLRRGVTIGANATIVCGIEIGAYAFVGAGAVVTKDVKPFALMVGNPAKQIGWMSRHGEKLPLSLEGSGSARCPETGEQYCLEDGSLAIEEGVYA